MADSGEQQAAIDKRKEELRELVHVTAKDLIWMSTKYNKGTDVVEICIAHGSEGRTINIPVSEILENQNSCKGFLNLIKTPLEALLRDGK